MDLTQGTLKEKVNRSKKTMMWFAMVSMGMVFAGLTSAYVVSKSRNDWLSDLVFPSAFIYSTMVVVVCSLFLHIAIRAIKKSNRALATGLLLGALVLAVVFIILQFEGFEDIIAQGYFFTGSESTVTTSFIYAIVITHLAHVVGGLLVLFTVIYNHFKQKYQPAQTLGLELGAMYWHFVDFLWVYLFFFLYFFR
ncbi:cytochrome c oxidase subunit 3 [Aquimarina intermedia]|uniref:Cytochrome c oxidase subunit 3 n=1 Tax=Aquimarina intermedia TaxID=350814 RepID=A0A5S5C9D1_9FLAO|nr:cytochrome c oxidase subunit 3 [Aquimarina intermedia]TYP76015.1 cytochrome c oxidase subunit 3 [Aquimarina intermedia]